MLERPLISIIIPTFNHAHLIDETLDSLINQTFKNWECIVVDDGSTDNITELMALYCRRDDRFIFRERPSHKPKGANSCRNYGFELCKGTFIQWFDSDDIMRPDMLDIKLNKMGEDDFDLVVCEGKEILLDATRTPNKWELHLEGNVLLNHIRGRIVFGTNGPLFKKSFLLDKLLFDESLIIRQEWEFFNRLLLNDPIIGIINEPLYYYRTSTESIRGSVSVLKIKSKMNSDRIILKLINRNMPFDPDEDYIYRRDLFLKHRKYFKTLRQLKTFKGIGYGLITLILGLRFQFIMTGLKKVIRKPGILGNFFSSLFESKN